MSFALLVCIAFFFVLIDVLPGSAVLIRRSANMVTGDILANFFILVLTDIYYVALCSGQRSCRNVSGRGLQEVPRSAVESTEAVHGLLKPIDAKLASEYRTAFEY